MYKCPKHDCWLVFRERVINRHRGGKALVAYWGCPVPECRVVKANKRLRPKPLERKPDSTDNVAA